MDKRSIFERGFAILLSVILMAACFPLSIFAEDTTQGPDFSGTNLMNLENVQPSGYTTTTNPYGYDVGMSFWTEQDVLAYLKMTGIPYASVYGEIVEENGRLTTTGAKRTGCMFCMFGVHLEKKPNRFQRMALTHPKQYDFCIHKLGCGKVLDFLGVPYAPNGGEPIP